MQYCKMSIKVIFLRRSFYVSVIKIIHYAQHKRYFGIFVQKLFVSSFKTQKGLYQQTFNWRAVQRRFDRHCFDKPKAERTFRFSRGVSEKKKLKEEMNYKVQIKRSAEKSLLKLDEKTHDRIISKIIKLVQEPRPAGSKKLETKEFYRIK